ncbi:hypothetical protein Tco_1556172 [Tanacetum coccineum]
MSSASSTVYLPPRQYQILNPGGEHFGPIDEELSDWRFPVGYYRIRYDDDEDEREPMFVQAHDPDYVPEPIYPEYISLEDEHVFPAEEHPLPPVDSHTHTHTHTGMWLSSDPEEDLEEDSEEEHADYPTDGGDDDDDDDTDDEDEEPYERGGST